MRAASKMHSRVVPVTSPIYRTRSIIGSDPVKNRAGTWLVHIDLVGETFNISLGHC